MTGNKRKKRLAKLKKLRNIVRNNVSKRELYRWVDAKNVKNGGVDANLTPVVPITEDGRNVLTPKDVDPDWEFEEERQRESEREEERLQAWADNDLNR